MGAPANQNMVDLLSGNLTDNMINNYIDPNSPHDFNTTFANFILDKPQSKINTGLNNYQYQDIPTINQLFPNLTSNNTNNNQSSGVGRFLNNNSSLLNFTAPSANK